jgi:hypothetical protein
MTIAGGDIVSGMPDKFEYRVFSRGGTLQRTVRAAMPSAPVSPADARAARARFIGQAAPMCSAMKCTSAETARLTKAYGDVAERLTLPKTWPAYAELRGDDDGSVWVRRYTVNPADPQSWARFSQSGALQGTLLLPANLTVLRFSRGHVLVKQFEPVDGFSFVAAHRIEPVK